MLRDQGEVNGTESATTIDNDTRNDADLPDTHLIIGERLERRKVISISNCKTWIHGMPYVIPSFVVRRQIIINFPRGKESQVG